MQNALNHHGKAVKGSRVHIVGVAYKRNIDDMRESPALDVILLLKKLGAEISYSDPYVPTLKLDGIRPEVAGRADVSHAGGLRGHHHRPRGLRLPGLLASAKLIVDTRNAMKGFDSEKIVRL